MKKLLGSYLVTTICSWTITFLVPIYIYHITHSALWTSLSYFASMAPYILVTPFAGVWSDRYSKRLFLIWGDIFSISVAMLMYGSLSLFSDEALAVVLVALNFLFSSITATHHPIFQSVAPEVLEEDSLKVFNSFVNGIDNIIGIAAPLLVAVLLNFTTKDRILLVCGLGFVFSLPLIYFIRSAAAPQLAEKNVIRELIEGFSYVHANKNLVSFSLLFFFVNFGLALINSNLVFIFSSSLNVAQENLGYYYGVIGAGAVLGSFIASRLIGTVEDSKLIINCCFAAGVAALTASAIDSPLWVAAAWAASTAFQSIVVITFFTFRQRAVPQAILGRTIGVTRLIAYLAIPPASILGGWLMDAYRNPSLIMGLGGSAIILGSIIAHRAPAFQGVALSR